jgi:hypothetical protein
MALRGKEIRCVGGECYAHVFENPKMGVKRGLFWNFILECAPITWDGEKYDVSLLCDWVTLPTRSWQALGEVGLGDLPQRELLEASLYLSAHHDVRLSRLEIAHEREDLFRVHLGGNFDLEGYDEFDGAAIPIDTSGSVRFKGLIVVPGNLFPKPSSEADAVAVAHEFLDLENFAEPAWDGSRFLFEPRLAAD